jgi:hypothetical protein
MSDARAAEHRLELLLRPAPSLDGGAQPRLAGGGEMQLLAAPIVLAGPRGDEPLALERLDVASERGAIHHHPLGERIDGQWANTAPAAAQQMTSCAGS